MANPYENGGAADPFREQTYPPAGAAVPPTGSPPPASGYGAAVSPYGAASYADPAKPPSTAGPAAPPLHFYSGTGGGATPPPAALAPPSPTTGPAAAAAAAAGTGDDAAAAPGETSKFWTLPFYQQFFDINTRQVLLRLSNTLVPLNPPDFLMDRNWHLNESMDADGAGVHADESTTLEEAGVVLSRKADLYGPFWICTTLWMTLAVVSNVMSKIAYTKAQTTTPWKYDFSVATVAYAVIYLYCFLFGAVVWGIMQWKNLPATLTDTVCLYGYSMFIFELVAILCMIPYSAAQWVFVMVGGAWSTAYLLINMWHMWKTTLERNWFIGIVAFVSVFHMGLTVSFKLYFFNYKV
ncbi:Yip1 domain containing protein [Novymonas esmeraldas]|uniref:Protein YIPF n=1 Tax=Novymonas esmeraldas TaxID=1808958 RepID=A0AAW0F4M7_9TRYP